MHIIIRAHFPFAGPETHQKSLFSVHFCRLLACYKKPNIYKMAENRRMFFFCVPVSFFSIFFCIVLVFFNTRNSISITYVFSPCRFCADLMGLWGSLIIPTLRPEYENSVFWLRGYSELYGRWHAWCQGSFSREYVDVTLLAYSRD